MTFHSFSDSSVHIALTAKSDVGRFEVVNETLWGVWKAMTSGNGKSISRRTILGSTAAATIGVGGAVLGGPAARAAAEPNGGPSADTRSESPSAGGHTTDAPVARGSFTVVDRRGRQRLLADTRKPPIIIGGKTYPAQMRQGPDNASYLIFNDDDGNERGGLVAHLNGGHLSLDYPNAQGITLAAHAAGDRGEAKLYFAQAPNADLPIESVGRIPNRVELGWDCDRGSILELNDSKGRPRIRLQVGPDDTPRVQLLDEAGGVVAQFPG